MAGGSPEATASAPATAERAFAAVCFFAATAFLATALPFFFAAFLLADFRFRVRIAFFCIEVRFVGMDIPRLIGVT